MTWVYRSDSVVGKVRSRETIVVSVLVAGCLADPPQAELEDDRAQALLEDLQGQDYRAWPGPPMNPDDPRRARAAGPHGTFVEIYLDPVLQAALLSEVTLEAWPVGATVVAEGYDDEVAAEAALFNIARKSDRGWIWAQLDDDEDPLAYGQPDGCVGCHGGAADRIFSLELPVIDEEPEE